MYIQKVKLQNFRSFGDEGICFLFNKGIQNHFWKRCMTQNGHSWFYLRILEVRK